MTLWHNLTNDALEIWSLTCTSEIFATPLFRIEVGGFNHGFTEKWPMHCDRIYIGEFD